MWNACCSIKTNLIVFIIVLLSFIATPLFALNKVDSFKEPKEFNFQNNNSKGQQENFSLLITKINTKQQEETKLYPHLKQVLYPIAPVLFGGAYAYYTVNTPFIQDSLKPPPTNSISYKTWNYITDSGLTYFPITLAAFLLLQSNSYHKKSGYLLLRSLVVGGIVLQFIKMGVGRSRPYKANNEFSHFSLSSQYHSFPSGHSFTAFSFAQVMARRYGYKFLWLRWAIAVAISRVVLGKHYFSDVNASALFVVSLNNILFPNDTAYYTLRPVEKENQRKGALLKDDIERVLFYFPFYQSYF